MKFTLEVMHGDSYSLTRRVSTRVSYNRVSLGSRLGDRRRRRPFARDHHSGRDRPCQVLDTEAALDDARVLRHQRSGDVDVPADQAEAEHPPVALGRPGGEQVALRPERMQMAQMPVLQTCAIFWAEIVSSGPSPSGPP